MMGKTYTFSSMNKGSGRKTAPTHASNPPDHPDTQSRRQQVLEDTNKHCRVSCCVQVCCLEVKRVCPKPMQQRKLKLRHNGSSCARKRLNKTPKQQVQECVRVVRVACLYMCGTLGAAQRHSSPAFTQCRDTGLAHIKETACKPALEPNRPKQISREKL